MLTKEENARLTLVDAGTPMGELMRRYWHPIAAVSQLDENPTKAVKLLGESLTLYKDRSGNLGLIGDRCPHRNVNLLYGIPEQEGLRCPYHGWLFNHKGQCIEQPYEQAEDPNSNFKDKIHIKSYPVQQAGGLIFAYLGPQPAPELPRWDLLVWDNVYRDIGFCVVPCNWLQIMENSVDPVHAEWLHGVFANYVWERLGQPERAKRIPPHKKIGFDIYEYGILKRRVLEGDTEENPNWKNGHPLVFPHLLKVGGFQWRIPIDDEHTLHIWHHAYQPPPGVPGQGGPRRGTHERVPRLEAARYVKLQTEESRGMRRRKTTLRQISSAGAGGGATKVSPVPVRGSATPVTAEDGLQR